MLLLQAVVVVVEGWRTALRAGRTGAKDAMVVDGSFKDEALASIGVWEGAGYTSRAPSVSLSCSTFFGVEISAGSEGVDVPAPETWGGEGRRKCPIR